MTGESNCKLLGFRGQRDVDMLELGQLQNGGGDLVLGRLFSNIYFYFLKYVCVQIPWNWSYRRL